MFIIFNSDVKPLPKLNPPSPDRNKKKKKKFPHTKRKKVPGIPILTPSVFDKTKIKASKKKGHEIIKLNSSDWIFTQVTALSSTSIEDPYFITERGIRYVNNNGNSWRNEDLEKYYSSFIGGHNYYNHEQEQSRSYGFIADASIRNVDIGGGESIKYVDLLVCTSINMSPNMSIINRIINKSLNTLSMSCVSPSLRCTRCGNISSEDKHDCEHVLYQVGKKFFSSKGHTSVVSELVYPIHEDGTVKGIEFFEQSWVDDPAFKGSVGGFRIKFPKNTDVFFSIPGKNMDRSNPDMNGVKTWIDRGLIKIVNGRV